MKQNWTEEERTWLAKVKTFSQEHIAPHAARWEAERRMPTEIFRLAGEANLLGIRIPKEQGGTGGDFSLWLKAGELFAKECMALSFGFHVTQNVTTKIAKEGSAAHIERYVPALLKGERLGCTAMTEPQAGSDFAAITTSAKKVAGGWVLNGEKSWLTNGAVSDVIMTYVQTDREQRGRGIACFLVDAQKEGFERLPVLELSGGYALGTGGFRLHDYFAKEEDLYNPPGDAFRATLENVNLARTFVAAMCCGMMERALECAVTYGNSRKAFGKSLLEHQGLKWKLADIYTELEAARLLTQKAAEIIATGVDARVAAAHAKKYTAEVAVKGIATCLQAMGAEGFKAIYPLARHLQNAKIAGIIDGTTEMQNERIAIALTQNFCLESQ